MGGISDRGAGLKDFEDSSGREGQQNQTMLRILALTGLCVANTVVTNKLVTNLWEATTQVQRIGLLQDSDFIFDFNNFNKVGKTTPGLTHGPDGRISTASTQNMPALVAEDVSLSIGSIGPCGM